MPFSRVSLQTARDLPGLEYQGGEYRTGSRSDSRPHRGRPAAAAGRRRSETPACTRGHQMAAQLPHATARHSRNLFDLALVGLIFPRHRSGVAAPRSRPAGADHHGEQNRPRESLSRRHRAPSSVRSSRPAPHNRNTAIGNLTQGKRASKPAPEPVTEVHRWSSSAPAAPGAICHAGDRP